MEGEKKKTDKTLRSPCLISLKTLALQIYIGLFLSLFSNPEIREGNNNVDMG